MSADYAYGVKLAKDAARSEREASVTDKHGNVVRTIPSHLADARDYFQQAAEVLGRVAVHETDEQYKNMAKKKAAQFLARSQAISDSLNPSLGMSYNTVAFNVKQKQYDEVSTETTSRAGDVRVSASLRQVGKPWTTTQPGHTTAEFTTLRYTPVACQKPILFKGTPAQQYEDAYNLKCLELGHKIKYFVTVTMYNEDDSEMQSTLQHLW
jgi:hypothetical protein